MGVTAEIIVTLTDEYQTHVNTRIRRMHAPFGSASSLWLWLIHCIQALAGREPGISRKDEPTIDKVVRRK